MIKGKKALEQRALELFPDNELRRKAWLKAVGRLRESKTGWALDHKVERREAKPQLLEGYRAPVEIQTVVALPPEQVVPPVNVAPGPWKKASK